MIKTDILFTGFYGQSNTGDDAFVEVAAWGAETYWKKNRVRFLAKSKKLPDTIVPSRGYPITIPKTYQVQSECLLKTTNAFIFAGGSTIHSKIKRSSIRAKAFREKAGRSTLSIGAIGVSIGPFKTSSDERAVESYLQQMDFLAVRDERSYEIASSFDLPYKPVNAFDLAALLPKIYNFTPRPKKLAARKIIGISVCPYESIQRDLDVRKEESRNQMTVDLISQIDKVEKVHFKFFIINGNELIGDRRTTENIIARVQPRSYEIVEYNRSVQSVWYSISECDFIISTRLHAAIFACFSNVPFMLNEYHRKCGDFLQSVGYHEQYRLFDSEYCVNERANQILEVINNKTDYIAPSMLLQMQEKAKLNFSAISV